jgi:ABC-type anion transport system duplicated permease subunit
MYVSVSAVGVGVLAIIIGLFACCCSRKRSAKVDIAELAVEEPIVKKVKEGVAKRF